MFLSSLPITVTPVPTLNWLFKKALLKIETPTTPDEFGAATIINSLIQDESQAIQGYNDAVATFSTMGMDDNIINIFKDIANEENIHVGQLQKALEAVSPNADSIKAGEKEGAEQLDVPVEEGAAKQE